MGSCWCAGALPHPSLFSPYPPPPPPNLLPFLAPPLHPAAQVRELANANLELLIKLKQGCDEMESDSVVTDYSDAALIPRAMVDSANSDILKQGSEKVGTLTKIKDFRKSINVMKWEHEYLRMQVRLCAAWG